MRVRAVSVQVIDYLKVLTFGKFWCKLISTTCWHSFLEVKIAFRSSFYFICNQWQKYHFLSQVSSAFSMPSCIECGFYMEHIIDLDTRTVIRCPQCDHSSDIYYECDVVQKWVDVALLRRRAWAHILFNDRDLFLKSIYVALFCCFLDAFVVYSNTVLRSQLASSSNEVALQSLQLVRIIKGPHFSSMNYASALPSLFFFSVEEYFLISVAACWMGSIMRRHFSNPLRSCVLVVSLATASKLCLMIFLTFMTPSSLLPIVDLVFFLWLTQGFRILLRDQSLVLAFACVFVCALTRFSLRFASGWAPQIFWNWMDIKFVSR